MSNSITAGPSEAETAFKAGMALLTIEHPPEDWRRGIALVEEASANGSADATECRAIFRAMGLGMPVDWNAALDLLAIAAEQGSQRVARQLAVLAGDADSKASPATLRPRIMPERLFSPPQVELLSLAPRIGVLRAFASPSECQCLIDASRAKLTPSTIFDDRTGGLIVDERRTAEYMMCNPIEIGIIVEVIRARLSRAVGLPLPNFEMSQMLHYTEGQEFKPHHDYFDPSRPGLKAEIETHGQRIATQLIYLNDDFEGGETQFPSLGFNFRGDLGDALVFFNIDEQGDPEPLTLHSGLPPTKGEKWLFSQWIRDRRSRAVAGSGHP